MKCPYHLQNKFQTFLHSSLSPSKPYLKLWVSHLMQESHQKTPAFSEPCSALPHSCFQLSVPSLTGEILIMIIKWYGLLKLSRVPLSQAKGIPSPLCLCTIWFRATLFSPVSTQCDSFSIPALSNSPAPCWTANKCLCKEEIDGRETQEVKRNLKSHKDSEAKNIQINFHRKVKELLQWRITGLNVNIMT